MSSVSPTNQDLSNDTTFSKIKSRVPVPLNCVKKLKNDSPNYETHISFCEIGTYGT